MIDAVIDLGFNVTCHYTGKVYIPYLPSNITGRKLEKPIRFMRRQPSTIVSLTSSAKGRQRQIMELVQVHSSYLFKVETFDD